MPTPDTNEMRRMQQDAVRRVQEMQTRSKNLSGIPKPESSVPPVQEPPRISEPPHPVSITESTLLDPSNPITNIFDGLLKDSERTLILVLILLLVSEKADTELVFALMFLII